MPLALSSARLLLNATNKTRTQLQAELWMICIFITWSFRQGLWKYVDGVNVTVVTLKSMLLPSCFLLLFFFQDSSLIKIKIWSQNLGPGELFISLHSYKGILLFPAFLLKDTECKSLSRVWLFETLRTVVPRLLCPWNSPGQNTGVGSWLPSLGDLPDPGIEVSCIAGRFFTSCDSKSPSQHWKMHQPASSP